LAGETILVVEDDDATRAFLADNLKADSYGVVAAASARQALNLLEVKDCDLMLLDVMLPDIGGFEVARRLAADDRSRDLPIVFLSARTDRADVRAGYEAGGVEYITKPFDPIALGGRIGEILEQVGSGDAAAMRSKGLAALDDGD
jgi:DNA-binding response OmpR family regulator